MSSQTMSIDSLRKCRICGLEAYTAQDLEKFVKNKRLLHGRDNQCKSCRNTISHQGGKYWYPQKNKRAADKNNPRRIKFLGKDLVLSENPRTNVCSECGRSYPEELKQQTVLHHIAYDSANPLLHTLELCVSCHSKTHAKLQGLGTRYHNGKRIEKE